MGGSGTGGGAGAPTGSGGATAIGGGAAARTGGVGVGGRASGGASGTCGSSGGSSGGFSGGSACDCPTLPVAQLGVVPHPSEGAAHTQNYCDPVCYGTMPPSSGTHYGIWPVYKTYAEPVPWGFLVHGLEHGAVEIFYNCPGGCPTEVASAQAFVDGLPGDSNCAGARPRVVLAPSPMLDVRWAASAWMWTLRSDRFDQATFLQFFQDHYDHGPEVICPGGIDLSSTRWCP